MQAGIDRTTFPDYSTAYAAQRRDAFEKSQNVTRDAGKSDPTIALSILGVALGSALVLTVAFLTRNRSEE